MHPTPLAQGFRTLNWDRSYTEERTKFAKICWPCSCFPLLKRLCPALSSKENQQQPYTGERTEICGALVGADAWAGLACLRPRDRQDFTEPCSACPGLVDGLWSRPDIPNLPHGLYRTLNSVSRDKHIFLQEFWIMTALDNFAIFAAPNSQIQLYK